MDFKVQLSDGAIQDIDDVTEYIANESIIEALNWKTGVESILRSLATMPGRFAMIPESNDLSLSYRAAIYHSHRVIFRIDEATQIV